MKSHDMIFETPRHKLILGVLVVAFVLGSAGLALSQVNGAPTTPGPPGLSTTRTPGAPGRSTINPPNAPGLPTYRPLHPAGLSTTPPPGPAGLSASTNAPASSSN